MSIGVFGVAMIALTPFLIWRKENLLLAGVFFAPYYECGVISIGSVYLQPGHYFLFLYLLSVLLRKKVIIHKQDYFLVGFVLVAFVSIFVAFIFRIDTQVYGIGNGVQLESCSVDTQNFTQFLYLLLGFIMFSSICGYVSERGSEGLDKILKICLYSGISVLGIGVYQLVADAFGLPFTAIFRTSSHVMWQQLSRVQATMGEASYLGQYLIWCMVFILFAKNLENRIVKYALLILLLFIGVRTRSSTFFVSLVVVFASFGLLQKQGVKMCLKYIFICSVGLAMFMYLYSTNSYVQVLVNNTYDKFTLSTSSGLTRSQVFLHMLQVGLSYPITGIGYGGGRSQDIYTSVFATTGFLGFSCFFGFIICNFIRLLKVRSSRAGIIGVLLIVGVLITGISVPEINYLMIWVVFAIIKNCALYGKSSS